MGKRLSMLPTPSPAEPWYKDGLRFECQETGKCCTNHGEYAWVYVSPDEEKAIAAQIGVTLAVFRRDYTFKDDGYRCLKSVDDGCIFLANRRCTIHEVKPTQCRTWPFWTGNLERKVWEGDVASFCAGVGKGRLYTREEIEAIATEHDHADDSL